ncbi:MAG: efflux RND transporter permease subunit, partial [Lentisphaerae bacterium]
MYNVRSLFIIALTMPLTVVIGLFFMQMAGFSINTSTLIAIGMSVGILVTNTIVVLESILGRLQQGKSPREAALTGTTEVVVAIIASASTNLVVLLPLAMMGSMVGLFMRPLALTMLIMTLVSLFISFTLTPMLASRLLRQEDGKKGGLVRRFQQRWDRMFNALVHRYGSFLEWNRCHPRIAALLVIALIASWGSIVLIAPHVGNGFIEESDRGEVTIKVEFPITYSLEHTTQAVKMIEQRLADLPGRRHTLSMIGKVEGILGQASEGVYLAQITITFPQKTERPQSIDTIMEMIRQRLEGFPDALITVSKPALIGGQSIPVQLEIAGDDFDVLDRLSAKILEQARSIPGLLDMSRSVKPLKRAIQYQPRRHVLTSWHLPPQAIAMMLRSSLEGMTAGTFKTKQRNYDIVVKMDRPDRQGESFLNQLLLNSPQNRVVPLPTVVERREKRDPVIITRKDKQRIAIVYANLSPELP